MSLSKIMFKEKVLKKILNIQGGGESKSFELFSKQKLMASLMASHNQELLVF